VTVLESPNQKTELALRELANDASRLFAGLLAQGAELPYEVEPADSDAPLPMYEYRPLVAAFVHDHVSDLRGLDSFGEASQLVGEDAAIGFLIGLWDGRSEFEIDEARLRGAVAAVIASEPRQGDMTTAGEVVVPLVGFHMPSDSIGLDGVEIRRASAVADLPPEALEACGDRGFVASVGTAAPGAPGTVVADDLRRAIRTMRLFRSGNVGLGAYGWVRRAAGWERFGTGVNRPRQGGYRLTAEEAGDLERFSARVAAGRARSVALDWAISRFDLGAERPSLIEALSDYLLALRGMLEGGGASKASLAARAAALGVHPDEREGGRMTVERGLALERKMMSGARFVPTTGSQPLEVIASVEEILRGILRSQIVGELSGDLRTRADEILLADGLKATETIQETGAEGEWHLPDPRDSDDEVAGPSEAVEGAPTTTRIVLDEVDLPVLAADERTARRRHSNTPARRPSEEGAGRADDWLAATGEVQWPEFAGHSGRKRRGRERTGLPGSVKASMLFQVPDATDWEIGELRYERKRRRAG